MSKSRSYLVHLTVVLAILLFAVALAPVSYAQSLPEITFSYPAGTSADL